MSDSKTTQRTCPKGHRSSNSTDCPICPTCEAEKKPSRGFLSELSAPARRALEREGITSVHKLAQYTEKEILKLHGVGPSTVPILKKALSDRKLSFKLG